MDTILRQLLSVSAGLVRRENERRPLSNSLHALDHHIDIECEKIDGL
jgi:hypothetical protein